MSISFTITCIIIPVLLGHVIASSNIVTSQYYDEKYNLTSQNDERAFFGLGGSSDTNTKQASIWLTSLLPAMFSPSYRCTGAIIGREHVLTSATCVDRFSSERLQVSDGEVNLSDSSRLDQVLSINVNMDIDLAVLRVSKDFFRQSSVATLVGDRLVTGDKCVVSGWNYGKNEWEQQVVSYMTSEDCIRAYSSVNIQIREGEICATPEVGNSSCKESLGWQLECNGELTGLFSWTHYSCERPSVYSSVEDSMPWISEATGNASRNNRPLALLLALLAIVSLMQVQL